MSGSGAARFRFFGAVLLFITVAFNPWSLALVLNPGSKALAFSSRLLITAFDVAVLLTALLLLLRNPEKLRGDLQNYALLAGSLAVSILLVEGFLRIFTPTPIFHPDLALYPFKKLALHSRLLGVSGEALHTTNEWGMRGDPIPQDWDDRFTIVAIGGSTTHCYYLGDAMTWPALLQTELRALDPALMVQNAGLDGHSTRGHLLMMEKVVSRIRPDMVILLVGLNDLSYSIYEQHLLFGNPNERTGAGYAIYARSRLAQLLYKWFQVRVNKAPVVKAVGQGSPDGYDATPLLDPSPLPERLESMLPSLEEFRANLGRIIEVARELNITPVFLTQPLLFDETPGWEGVKWDAYWLGNQKYAISAATFWRMQSIFNENLLRICESHRVACFDLASAVPHDQKYFYDAAHFNEAGAALVASRVAGFLEREGLVPETR